jgi:hypothetical protein
MRRRLAVAAVLAAMLAASLIGPASSSAATSGQLTCNASALTILGINLSQLLGTNEPCSEAVGGIDLPLSAGNKIYILRGATTVSTGTGSSQAAVLDLSLLSSSLLPVAVLRSSAYVTCNAGKLQVNAGSNILEGGQTLVTGPITAPKPIAIGSLIFINETVADATGITQRALRVSTPAGDIVLAEARAGSTGNPCTKLRHRRHHRR